MKKTTYAAMKMFIKNNPEPITLILISLLAMAIIVIFMLK